MHLDPMHDRVGSGNKKYAAEPTGIGKVGFIFLRFPQLYFKFLALKTATFQRTEELLIERLDSNNCACPNKHHIGWSASKINNRM